MHFIIIGTSVCRQLTISKLCDYNVSRIYYYLHSTKYARLSLSNSFIMGFTFA